MLKYRINIIAEMKKAGYSTVRIRRERIVGESTLQKMRSGDTSINLESLGAICNILQCQLSDLVEWVPDENR